MAGGTLGGRQAVEGAGLRSSPDPVDSADFSMCLRVAPLPALGLELPPAG